MTDAERIARLEEALDEVVTALRVLLSYDGSSHSLKDTKVGQAMHPLVERAEDLLVEIRDSRGER